MKLDLLLKKIGFSLVELMIVMGAISGIALIVMQLSKNTSSSQSDAFNAADYFALRSQLDTMLSNSYDCPASLKGVTFQGSSIKTTPIDVEIWHGDQNGNRTRKFLSSGDAAFKKFGKLAINSVKFNMPDYTDPGNFPTGVGEVFKGQIVISGDKTKMGKTSGFVDIVKPVNITFDTDAGGTSTIKDCASIGAGSSAGLGVGQTWQNLNASRAVDTDYTNNSGRPIMISVSLGPNPNPGWGDLTISLNGIVVSHSQGNWNGASGYLTGSIVVPDGSSYRVSGGARMPIEHWAELR